MTDLAKIGRRIQAVRQNRTSMSQEALARQLGVSWITVSRLERGVGKSLDLDRLHDVASALGTTVDELIRDAA